jgi:hypothetical protein
MKKKNTSHHRKLIRILLVVLIIGIPIISSVALAWNDCPFGLVDDPFPGLCSRYVDTDGDGICDRSQLAPEERSQSQENTDASTTNQQSIVDTKYFFIPIAVCMIVIYSLSLLLSKKKKIKVSIHRKIWNVLLLITFLVTGILGLLLVFRVSFSLAIPYLSDLLFWHVEFGIAMTMISIFHIIWHWNYFKKMVTKK